MVRCPRDSGLLARGHCGRRRIKISACLALDERNSLAPSCNQIDFPGARAKSMQTTLAIEWQRHVAEDFRQFSSRPSAGKIHLEIPVLRVRKSRGKRHVGAVFTAYRRNTQIVAFYNCR